MATLKDVATTANVSLMTVSRVINEPELVKPATRKMVEEAIRKTGYAPNLTAKALAKKQLGVVDVYIPEHIDLSNSFAMHFIAGISDVLSRHMYSFLILRSRETPHRCDGYIVMGLLKNEVQTMAQYVKNRNCPMVLFGHTDVGGIHTVDVDNVKGIQSVAEYLLGKGHRRIAMINVAEDKDYTQDRLQGYRQALESAGLPYLESLVYQASNNENSGCECALKVLKEQKITAILCATDVLALGTIRAAKSLGLMVPEELSVTGFDGLGYQLMTEPRIVTGRQPVYEAGQKLARLLIEQLDDPGMEITHTYILPELLLGGSVAEPAENGSSPSFASHGDYNK
jgi:DNA-binding LacI/PurR family transcriptional regulator